MNVVLTRDFIDRHVGNPEDPDGPPIAVYRSTTHRGKTVEWRKGTVLDMSDASAQKYIARGEAMPAE